MKEGGANKEHQICVRTKNSQICLIYKKRDMSVNIYQPENKILQRCVKIVGYV